jgi:cytochrome c oxidase assembly protein Cox11
MSLAPTTRTALQAVGVVVTMGSLAWASVPLYDWFCRVTGYGGATGVAEADGYAAEKALFKLSLFYVLGLFAALVADAGLRAL